jgi:perosamine synthetase
VPNRNQRRHKQTSPDTTAAPAAAQHRDKILEAMKKRNIQVSNYFSPVHFQPFMVERFGYKPGDFPITESVSKSTIALPFYNNLIKDHVAIVSKTLKEILDENLFGVNNQ